ncbi:MAG: hypothetical protein WCF84_03085 [Anaerolineae bacterium]
MIESNDSTIVSPDPETPPPAVILAPPDAPPASPVTPPASPSASAILGVLFGGVLALAALCGVLAYLIVPFMQKQDALSTNTLIAALTGMALVYGGLVLYVAIPLLRRRAAPQLRLPPARIFLVLFLIVVLLGVAVLWFRVAPVYLFPPWHVLAAGMMSLAALAYALRRLKPVAGSTLVAQLTWGGLGTIVPAVVLELLAGVAIVVVVVIGAALILGVDRFQQLARQLQSGLRGGNLDFLLQSLQNQPLLTILVGAAAVFFISGVVPVVEELLKSLAPAITIARSKPTAAQALLWGLAAGAGYAFTENLLNGSGSVTSQTGGDCAAIEWAAIMTIRAGTSLMHIATTTTISVGWYAWFVRGRPRRFFLFLLVGLATHGLWNVVALGMGAALTQTTLCNISASTLAAPGTLMGLAALLTLLAMVIGAGVWIGGLVQWARRQAA